MIEECIPFSFIDHQISVMENQLEYDLFEDNDRKATLKLSHQIDALKDLKKEWLKVNK